MKKILSLLALVLMSCMGAWAETTEVTAIKASSIAHPVTYRMWLTDSQSRTCIITQNLKQAGYDAGAEQARFAFIATGQLDEYYMYETVSQKYVKADNASNTVKDATRLVDTPDEACKWKIVASTTQKRWLVSPKGRSTFMNFYKGLGENQGGQTIGFYTDGNNDQGSRWAFDLIENNSVANPTEWVDNTGYKVEALSTPALTSVAEGYYAILGMDQLGNNCYYLYDNGTKVQGKVWENAPELVWYVKSDGNGKYSFRNFKSGKYMTVGQGNGAALNMSESVANYNFLIQNGYAFIDDGTYGVDVANVGTSPTAWTGHGYTDSGSRRLKVYPVEIVLDETPKYDVTYDVYFNDTKLYSEVVSQNAGSAAAYALPEEYTYLNVEVPNVTINEAQTVRVNTSYNSNLPFVVGDYYNMTVREYNIYADLEGGNSIKSIKTERDYYNQAFFDWKIGGDWYNGFTFQNKTNDKYLSYGTSASPTDNTNATLVDVVNDGAKFNLKFKRRDNTDRWSLSLVGTTNYTYINRRGDNLSTWADSNALGEVGSAIVFTPAEEINDVPVVVTFNYTSNSGATWSVQKNFVADYTLEESDYAVDFYTNFNITSANQTVSESNTTFNITCDDNFPFTAGVATRIQSRGSGHQDMDFYNGVAYPQYGANGFDPNTNLWVFEHVANSANLFTVKNVATGKYLTFQDGTRKIGTLVETASNSGAHTSQIRVRKSTYTSAPEGAFCLQHPTVVACCYGPHINDISYGDPVNNGLGGWAADDEAAALSNNQNCLIAIAHEACPVKLTNPNPGKTNGLNGKYVGTFSAVYNVQLPDGVVAYKAAINGTTVNFTEIGSYVPANTGVLLYAEGAQAAINAEATPCKNSTADTSNNAFVATDGNEIPVDSYILANKNNHVAFYHINPDSRTVAKNKAYLPASAGSNLNAFRFDFEDTLTGIEAIENQTSNAIYDLQGRRVENAKSGLYIVNGKKVIR